MNRGRWLNAIGLVLLVSALAWSSFRVFFRGGGLGDDRIVIRFSHWQLESGLREAFDAIAAEYMAMHPGVRIQQMAVPGRVLPVWQRTGMVGGNLPDLMVVGSPTDEILVRYFTPLTREVLQPNPYNAGTDLENVPWRDTFIDGMASSHGLATLQDYYSVANAILTTRMYYNPVLWREIFGDRPLPDDYRDFIEVCQKAAEHFKASGQRLVPIAGSRFTANVLFDELFRSQTQKLVLEKDRLGSLSMLQDPSSLAFLPGYAGIDDPPIRDGLALVREVAEFMQPGFLQLDRDDAILHFAQGRALMLPSGAWDYNSIVEQCPFKVGVFPVPFPAPEDPRYGNNVLGRRSESGLKGATSFCVSAGSRHPEVAVDFLKFMTSRRGNQIFASMSKWPPAVLGVEASEETRAFMPRLEGSTNGIVIAPIMWGSGDLYRVQYQNFHRLIGDSGSVEAFVEAVRPEFGSAVRSDVLRQVRQMRLSVMRMDGLAAGLSEVSADENQNRRLSGVYQVQNSQEALAAWLEREARGMKTASAAK